MPLPERPWPLAVTWSHEPSQAAVSDVHRAAETWRLPLYERPHKSGLRRELGRVATAFLVRGGTGWRLLDAHGEIKVTPGLAMLRLKRLASGSSQSEPLLEHSQLRPGDVVIDATLGLGADARVMARAVGPSGRIVGLESSLPLAALLTEGLTFETRFAGSGPIEVHATRALDFLVRQPSASVDVVFFDPMFDRTLGSSPAFVELRRYADHSPLDPRAVSEARRVARRWVVMKSSDPSVFPGLGLEALIPAAGAHVFWGRAHGNP
jgi:16S rRNA (guanine1516-N2)-methyltransferase